MYTVTHWRDGVTVIVLSVCYFCSTSYDRHVLCFLPSISFHAVSALSQPELNDLLAKRHLYHSTRTELIHIQLKLTY